MNGKFIVYSLVVAFVCVAASWGQLISSGQGQGGSRSGSSWSSSSSSSGYSGGGGHK